MLVFKLSSWELSGFTKLSQAHCRAKERPGTFCCFNQRLSAFPCFISRFGLKKGAWFVKKKKKSLQKHNSRNTKLTLSRQIIIFVLSVSRLHYLQIPSIYTFKISKILMKKVYLYANTSIIAQWRHTLASELGCFLNSLVTYLIWRV